MSDEAKSEPVPPEYRPDWETGEQYWERVEAYIKAVEQWYRDQGKAPPEA